MARPPTRTTPAPAPTPAAPPPTPAEHFTPTRNLEFMVGPNQALSHYVAGMSYRVTEHNAAAVAEWLKTGAVEIHKPGARVSGTAKAE